jgi:hypothetical protein
MGIGIFPSFRPEVEGAIFNSDGKLLASLLPQLDSICVRLGVTKLSGFTDNREPPAGLGFDIDADPEEVELLMGEWNEWFHAEAAIPTLEALVAAIPSQPDLPLHPRDRAALSSDLREILSSLRLAAEAGATFRLELF